MTHKHAKLRISSIIADILHHDQKYMMGQFIRWGIVESDLHCVIDCLKNSKETTSVQDAEKR